MRLRSALQFILGTHANTRKGRAGLPALAVALGSAASARGGLSKRAAPPSPILPSRLRRRAQATFGAGLRHDPLAPRTMAAQPFLAFLSTVLALALSLGGCAPQESSVNQSAEESAPQSTPPGAAASSGTTNPRTTAQAPTTAESLDPAGEAGADAVLFEEVEISDPAREGRVAFRVLVPEGWEVEGGVTAIGPAYHMIPTISDVTVRAPDGRGVRFWGMLEYGYADGLQGQLMAPYEGRPYVPIPRSLGEHWRRMFDAFPAEGVTKLKIVSETVLPEATKELRQVLAPLYESTRREDAQLRPMGQSKEFEADARQLVIRYRDDGRPTEATIFATMRKAIYRNPGGSIGAAMWNLDHMYAVFGPVGTDLTRDPVLAAIVRSRRDDAGWQEAIQRWYLAKNQQIVAQGNAQIAAAARSAATSRTTQSQDVLDISFQGWKDRNAANSAGHSLAVNGIHERTSYVQPGGGTVDLPSHYSNVYTDGQGHYVLHDDANWQIQSDPNWNDRDWQRVEPER